MLFQIEEFYVCIADASQPPKFRALEKTGAGFPTLHNRTQPTYVNFNFWIISKISGNSVPFASNTYVLNIDESWNIKI